MNTFFGPLGSSCHLMDVSAYVKVVLCVHRDSFGTIFVYSEQYPSQYTSQGSLEAKLLFFLMHSLT